MIEFGHDLINVLQCQLNLKDEHATQFQIPHYNFSFCALFCNL